MARDTVKFNSAALFVGPTPATGQHYNSGNSGINLVTQIHRVQSANDGFEIVRRGTVQLGDLAEFDRSPVGQPNVPLSFEYLMTNGFQEDALGFVIDGQVSCLSGILEKTEDEKNYFMLFTPEGVDAANDTDRADHHVVAIGQGFITDITFNAAVDDLARASVTVEGLNYDIHQNSTGNYIPAVDPTDGAVNTTWQYGLPVAGTGVAGMPTVIRDGDITLDLSEAADLLGATLDGAGKVNIQSFSLSIPLARNAIRRLGNNYAYTRELQTPINATLQLETILSNINTGSLADLVNTCADQKYDFTINMKSCLGSSKEDTFKIILKGATLDTENFSLEANADRTASIGFTIPVGAANNTSRGVFLSGSANN